jgi:hypothetical protein
MSVVVAAAECLSFIADIGWLDPLSPRCQLLRLFSLFSIISIIADVDAPRALLT